MAVLLEDREAVRPLLMRDRIRNATVIHRVFHNPEFTLAFADRLPDPSAVLALRPTESADAPHQFALHATDPLAAVRVLNAVPPGACVFHVADELAFPAVRKRINVQWWGEAVYYTLDSKDFRDGPTDAVEPLDPKWAPRIAKIWNPDWPAEGYVRSRIEGGLHGAVYDRGEPVAWGMTHLETDDVVLLGFLHVQDAHRRRGYAKALTRALVRGAIAKGKAPCAHVFADNAPSIRLMEGLGFRRVCLQAWGDGLARA